MMANGEGVVTQDLSYKIIGLAMEAHRWLGSGCSEKVYTGAMMVLLRRDGIQAEPQLPLTVFGEETTPGSHEAKILVEGEIILDVKVSEAITDADRAAVIRYLEVTGCHVAVTLNFGRERLEYEKLHREGEITCAKACSMAAQ